jgi:Uma2 family endonuclease
MITRTKATLDDLNHIDEKAEIVNGEILRFMPTGRMPAFAAFQIAVSLQLFVRAMRLVGIAVPDNVGFHVNLPNRSSFSPDAAYYEGPNSGMKLFEGAPRFVVEVRSEGDHGPVAEVEMLEKRRDYFAAGTMVVWDVDLLNEPIVRKYTAPDAEHPIVVFHRDAIADAEPTVPGWTLYVADLFE